MASAAEMSTFNVLLCFVLLIHVVFLLFVNLIEHAYEKTAAINKYSGCSLESLHLWVFHSFMQKMWNWLIRMKCDYTVNKLVVFEMKYYYVSYKGTVAKQYRNYLQSFR